MYLHENREEFGKMVKAVSAEYNLPISTVEKDYYVTMILKLLAEKSGNCVFKGGTSLSKGFRILKRFSMLTLHLMSTLEKKGGRN